jgi:cytochrome P450
VAPSTEVVLSDGVLAVIAGSDTTATTFTALWYYLLLEPAMCDRLRQEVDAHFPPGEEPLDFMRMVNMPYLNACMYVLTFITGVLLFIAHDVECLFCGSNEALRLLPPVISGSQRSANYGSGGKVVGP